MTSGTTLTHLIEAKDRVYRAFWGHSLVRAIGIGQDCIHVYTIRGGKKLQAEIEQVASVPVKITEGGEIRAL